MTILRLTQFVSENLVDGSKLVSERVGQFASGRNFEGDEVSLVLLLMHGLGDLHNPLGHFLRRMRVVVSADQQHNDPNE